MNGAERVVLGIVPVPKPRMSQRDKWLNPPRPCVAVYRLYCDRLRGLAQRERFAVPDAGLALVFYLPMPPSWSKRKRAAMQDQPHQQKPDLDNLVKAFVDALCPDDARIWRFASLEKRWSDNGGIVAEVSHVRTAEEAA